MIKRGTGSGRVEVSFEIDPAVRAERANLCGDFNEWSQDSHVMQRKPDGGFSVTIELEAGESYRFRYLLDGERWENDWAADDYVPNEYGGDDSLVDLTNVEGHQPPPVKAAGSAAETPAKQAAAKKATATKADGGKKTPAKKAAAKKAADKGPAKKASGKKKPPEPPNPGI